MIARLSVPAKDDAGPLSVVQIDQPTASTEEAKRPKPPLLVYMAPPQQSRTPGARDTLDAAVHYVQAEEYRSSRVNNASRMV